MLRRRASVRALMHLGHGFGRVGAKHIKDVSCASIQPRRDPRRRTAHLPRPHRRRCRHGCRCRCQSFRLYPPAAMPETDNRKFMQEVDGGWRSSFVEQAALGSASRSAPWSVKDGGDDRGAARTACILNGLSGLSRRDHRHHRFSAKLNPKAILGSRGSRAPATYYASRSDRRAQSLTRPISCKSARAC